MDWDVLHTDGGECLRGFNGSICMPEIEVRDSSEDHRVEGRLDYRVGHE